MVRSARFRHIALRTVALCSIFCALILTSFLQANSISTHAETPTPTYGGTPDPSATAGVSPGSTTAHAVMQHTPSGTATVTYNESDKSLKVSAMMSGFKPNSSHPVQIEQGSCANGSGGQVLHKLNGLTADDHGRVDASATIQNVPSPPPNSGLRVNIYNGPGMEATDEKVSIACGDVVPQSSSSGNGNTNGTTPGNGMGTPSMGGQNTPSASGQSTPAASSAQNTPGSTPGGSSNNTFVAKMGPTQAPNEDGTGTATLNLNDGKLTVQFSVHNLAPNSTHAAHLHEGTCDTIGKIVYDMGDIKADAQGNAVATKTFDNVSSIPSNLAAQVHYGTDLSQQPTYNPIMCGNVVSGESTATPGTASTPGASSTPGTTGTPSAP